MLDAVIIGSGVIGCAIARELSRFSVKAAVLEAGYDCATGASKANSGIVHAGYDCKPGSLMAELNVRGNELYTRWASELDVPLKRCGSLVLAFDESDEREISKLYEQGLKNGVPGMKIIGREEILAREPNISPAVKSALFAETGGITCPYEMTAACLENAMHNGIDAFFGFEVVSIQKTDGFFTITASDGRSVSALRVINAAGLFADEIAAMAGDASIRITPRQGEYMLLDKKAGDTVKTVVFQTPSDMGKGVLVSPTVDGNLFIGPTAADSNDKRDSRTTDDAMAELRRCAPKSVPGVPFNRVITSFTGIRAVPAGGDFIIGESKAVKGLINAAGICSPGLTAAPAIAEMVARIIAESGLALNEKPGYNPIRHSIKKFIHMTNDQKNAAIAENPLYASIVCRCETVTEAEVVEAVRRGAVTLDSVKRRCRAGMGRCQGGFCSPRVMEIISRETGLPMADLTKFGGGSRLLAGRIKEALK